MFVTSAFTEFGKWMDGWETRRKRSPGWLVSGVLRNLSLGHKLFGGRILPAEVRFFQGRLIDFELVFFCLLKVMTGASSS